MRRNRAVLSMLLAIVFMLSGVTTSLASTSMSISVGGVQQQAGGNWLKEFHVELTADNQDELNNLEFGYNIKDATGAAVSVVPSSIQSSPPTESQSKYRMEYFGNFDIGAGVPSLATMDASVSSGGVTIASGAALFSYGPVTIDSTWTASLKYEYVRSNNDEPANSLKLLAAPVPNATRYDFILKTASDSPSFQTVFVRPDANQAPEMIRNIAFFMDKTHGSEPIRCFQVVAYNGSEVLAVSGYHTLNTVEGTLKLPNSETAPAEGLRYSMELMVPNADGNKVAMSWADTITAGGVSMPFWLYAEDGTDASLQKTYGLQAHVDMQGQPYVQTLYYTSAGSVTSWDDMEKLTFSGGKTSSLNMELKPGLPLSVNLSLSAMRQRPCPNQNGGLRINAHILRSGSAICHGNLHAVLSDAELPDTGRCGG